MADMKVRRVYVPCGFTNSGMQCGWMQSAYAPIDATQQEKADGLYLTASAVRDAGGIITKAPRHEKLDGTRDRKWVDMGPGYVELDYQDGKFCLEEGGSISFAECLARQANRQAK